MKRSELRHVLFRRFSDNLAVVRRHPALKFDSDFETGTLCPLCLEVLQPENLSFASEHPKSVTLEDVPPKALGGKPTTVSCHSCNSGSGHLLDGNLQRKLERNDLLDLKLNASGIADISLLGDCVRATIRVTTEGYKAELYSKGFDPSQKKGLRENLENPPITLKGPTIDNPFSRVIHHDTPEIKLQLLRDDNRPQLALLRIAHLIAFTNFGHGWLLNGPLSKVRNQLCSPDDEILHGDFILPSRFPDEHLGINLIVFPPDLRSFLVVFDLETKSSTHRFGVLLPGPTEPDISIYMNLHRRLEIAQRFDIEILNWATKSVVRDPKRAFESLALWEHFVVKRGEQAPLD